MEAQLLKTFVMVARRGSFSAAAAELRYTQAAVSQQIAALETDLKTQLLNRRPVTPTEAGARLLEHAEPILLRMDAARTDVMRMAKTPPATLRIGVTPLAGALPVLATALAALRAQLPRLTVTIQTGSRRDTAIAVAYGDLDLALTDGLTAPGDPLPEQAPLTAIGLTEVPVRLVLPPDHPLGKRSSIRLADLAGARWIEAENVAPPLAEIRRHAATDGFNPTLHYTGTDTATLIALATAGNGLTLLPQTALRESQTATVQVSHPRLSHRAELLHATLPNESPAKALAAILTRQ